MKANVHIIEDNINCIVNFSFPRYLYYCVFMLITNVVPAVPVSRQIIREDENEQDRKVHSPRKHKNLLN